MSLPDEISCGYATCEGEEYYDTDDSSDICIVCKRNDESLSKSKITPRTDSESLTELDSDTEIESIDTDKTEIEDTVNNELFMRNCDACDWKGFVCQCNHCNKRSVCGNPDCCEMFILADHDLLIICMECKNEILSKLKPAKSNDYEYDRLMGELNEYEKINKQISSGNIILQPILSIF